MRVLAGCFRGIMLRLCRMDRIALLCFGINSVSIGLVIVSFLCKENGVPNVCRGSIPYSPMFNTQIVGIRLLRLYLKIHEYVQRSDFLYRHDCMDTMK